MNQIIKNKRKDIYKNTVGEKKYKKKHSRNATGYSAPQSALPVGHILFYFFVKKNTYGISIVIESNHESVTGTLCRVRWRELPIR